MTKIILLNGPPGCGKDTAAKLLHKTLAVDIYMYKMALPLKEACHKLLGLEGTLDDLEPYKEYPIKFLIEKEYNYWPAFTLINDKQEMTLRQFYIHISENVMKPMFGYDIFGKLAIENIRNNKKMLTTISDTGFVEEIKPIVEHFGVDNVCLVKIHREGCNFKKDSRSYITLNIPTIDIDNNETSDIFSTQLYNKIEHFIQ